MLKKCLPFFLLMTIVASCSKDKLNTKPSIEIKSINGTEFQQNQPVVITLKYNDKEGDLGGGSLTYLRNRLNVFYPVVNDLADSIGYALPDFPKTSTGEIQVQIPAGFLSENPDHNDTLNFKIFVKDAAGNTSDTVTTATLISIVN